MSAATYRFNVEMSCSACSNAVNKVLTRMDGVKKVDISMEKQSVLVEADAAQGATYEAVLAKISKTGKKVIGGERLRS